MREKMVKIAEDTLKILEVGSYKNSKGNQVEVKSVLENAVRNSVLYTPDMESKIDYDIKQILECWSSFQTVIEVTSETSLEATKRLTEEEVGTVVCLNFASARTPGGGFKKGSSAQEESIARSAGLFPCISQMREMYEHNCQVLTGFYSDYMIFSPDVPVFKDDEGNRLDKFYTVSFITSPAVNAGVVKDKAWDDRHMILEVMKRRIEKVLSLAILHQQEVLVLGAFGCGVFRNEPKDIAKLFKEVLEDDRFKHSFKKITFAVYDPTPTKENLLPFLQTFSSR
ncbi:TIGR02452 family protein (plasmid) [Brevibacillus halotolerans]|nr:TIGR02452 family protein [Brevibacillus halotolerans]